MKVIIRRGPRSANMRARARARVASAKVHNVFFSLPSVRQNGREIISPRDENVYHG